MGEGPERRAGEGRRSSPDRKESCTVWGVCAVPPQRGLPPSSDMLNEVDNV